jgi:hypothetical protein
VTRPACILLNVSLEQHRSIACCPTLLAELRRTMLKSFMQTSVLYNVVERVVITSKGIKVLLDGLISQ